MFETGTCRVITFAYRTHFSTVVRCMTNPNQVLPAAHARSINEELAGIDSTRARDLMPSAAKQPGAPALSSKAMT